MLSYSRQNSTAKFFIVMESKHVAAEDRMAQFFSGKQSPILCESTLEGRLAPSYCAIHSRRYVKDTDRVWNVFGLLNIISNRI
jgi:hypothetical protein